MTKRKPFTYDDMRYAGCEILDGRASSPLKLELFLATMDRTGHDSGDEDRRP